MNNKFYTLVLLLICISTYAQVGINTRNPQGIFNIDGGKDNAATGTPTAAQQENDFVVTTDGSVGIGNTAPVTRLDVRSTTNSDNSVAIGRTTQLAADAGAGAIRYHAFNGGKLQYSDGITWFDLVSFPEKVVVIANNTSGDRFSNGTQKQVYYNNELIDNFSAFAPPPAANPSATANLKDYGFKAPRDGVYLVTATTDLVAVVNNANSKAEMSYEVFRINPDGTYPATPVSVQKCTKFITAAVIINAQTPVQCLAGVRLNEGDVLQVRLVENVWGGTGTGINARTNSSSSNNDYGFVNLSILEQ